MTTGLGASFKKTLTIVRFHDGEPVAGYYPSFEYFYTDYTKDIVPSISPEGIFFASSSLVAGQVWVSVPDMQVEYPPNHGGIDQNNQPCRVTMPLVPCALGYFSSIGGDVTKGDPSVFVANASNGEPHSPIFFDVWEILLDPLVPPDPASTMSVLHTFSGRVTRVVRNYQGKADQVAFEATLAKNELQIPSGITINDQCAWQFGQAHTCKVPVPVLHPTLLTIVGPVCTFSSLAHAPAPGGTDGKYWHRGFCHRNGLFILIRDFDPASPSVLTLVRQPPAEWLGKDVAVSPGCDKTKTTCDVRWANLEHFGGMGYAIPAYNPLFETA